MPNTSDNWRARRVYLHPDRGLGLGLPISPAEIAPVDGLGLARRQSIGESEAAPKGWKENEFEILLLKVMM